MPRYIICIEICWFACYKKLHFSQEVKCKGLFTYQELYNEVHKRKDSQYVSNIVKDFTVRYIYFKYKIKLS